MTYKPIPTTKQEMLAAIEKLSELVFEAQTVNDTLRRQTRSKLHEQIGKLRSLAGHLPERKR